ncbi:MAG: restriction endonuclease subunit S [Chitinophagales bacterium]
MSKNNENKLMPKLRFPEFLKDKEWQRTTIGEVGKFYYGKSAPKWSLSDDAPTPCVRYGELYTKFNTIIDKIYSKTNIDPSTLRFSKGGEILVPRVGEVPQDFAKHCCYLPFENIAIGEMISVYETNEYPIFYTHYFRTLWREFAKVVEGQNVKNLYYINLEPIVVGKPSYKEQQKIADCLSSLDDVITAESQKLELLKDHKKGLLQNLFPQAGSAVPKFRFKEFENSGEWVVCDLLDTTNKDIKWSFTGGPFGSNLKAEHYTSTGIRIIQLQNIGDGEFIDDYKIYASAEKANELLSCNIYSGEIILSKMGDPVGRACIIPNHLERCIMASDGIRLVIDEKRFSKYFVYALINSKQIREAIERKSTGSTRKRIGLDELKKIKLPKPLKIEEQQRIASCLSSLDDLITAQNQKLEALQLHKKGLLQGLFPTLSETGFTGLKDEKDSKT